MINSQTHQTTDQTDATLNPLDANSERSPQATPHATHATERANFNLGLDETEGIEEAYETDPLANLHELSLHVPTITNSPRCVPTRSVHTSGQTSGQAANPKKPTTPRRVRTVRVDAWAVPASANWSRARTTVRKVNRGTPSTDWALPF